jgi:hypothetical protein
MELSCANAKEYGTAMADKQRFEGLPILRSRTGCAERRKTAEADSRRFEGPVARAPQRSRQPVALQRLLAGETLGNLN